MSTLTEEGRDAIRSICKFAVKEGIYLGVQGETGLGKTGTVIRTLPELTDEEIVIALPTKIARHEKYEEADELGYDPFEYKGRHDLCGVCCGDFNDELDFEADQYINQQANKRIKAQKAHDYLKDILDIDELPCERREGCPWKKQSDEYEDADPDLTFVTHEMLRAGMFRDDTFVVIDEMPQYQMDIGADWNDHSGPSRTHLRKACTSLLEELGAEITSWQRLVDELAADGTSQALELTQQTLKTEHQPADEWYLTTEWAHKMDMPILRALLTVEEIVRDRRYKGSVTWGGDDIYNQAEKMEVTVLLDEGYHLQRVWNTPNFRTTNSLLCLDAHPFELRWEANIGVDIDFVRALDKQEEKVWRRQERGLYVTQVGDARRPLTRYDRFSPAMTRTLLTGIDAQANDTFRSAIVPKTIERDVLEMFEDLLNVDPMTLHYGEQFGMDNLGDEDIGAVLGHVDPGDDDVLDYLAYHELDAEPAEETCSECGGRNYIECSNPSCQNGVVRAHDRKFRGPDREEARDILNGVVQRQVAQALGRYARNPNDPTDTAHVFVWTSVVPDHLVDEYTEGVQSANDGKKLEVVKEMAGRDWVTVSDICDNLSIDVSRQWVHRVMMEYADEGHADINKTEGTAADKYRLKPDTNPFGEVSLETTPEHSQRPRRAPQNRQPANTVPTRYAEARREQGVKSHGEYMRKQMRRSR